MFGQVLSFKINILIWFLGCEIIPSMFPKSYSVIFIKNICINIGSKLYFNPTSISYVLVQNYIVILLKKLHLYLYIVMLNFFLTSLITFSIFK